MTSGRLDQAVQEFYEAERAALLLDKKRRALTLTLAGLTESDRAEYERRTRKILNDFDEKREKAGLL